MDFTLVDQNEIGGVVIVGISAVMCKSAYGSHTHGRVLSQRKFPQTIKFPKANVLISAFCLLNCLIKIIFTHQNKLLLFTSHAERLGNMNFQGLFTSHIGC